MASDRKLVNTFFLMKNDFLNVSQRYNCVSPTLFFLGRLPPLLQYTHRFFLEEEAFSSPAFSFPMTEVTSGLVKEIAPGVDMPVSGCVSSSLGLISSL